MGFNKAQKAATKEAAGILAWLIFILCAGIIVMILPANISDPESVFAKVISYAAVPLIVFAIINNINNIIDIKHANALVIGEITKIFYSEIAHHCTYHVRYTVNGKEYEKKAYCHVNYCDSKRIMSSVDSKIEVYYHPQKPDKAWPVFPDYHQP